LSDSAPYRYAIYFAPPRDSGLWRLAQSWLGRDCETGAALPQPALEGWSAEEIAAVTASPRRYGFHATLKAPFRLAEDRTPAELHQSIAAFAARQQPFSAPRLKVSALGPFLALTFPAPAPQMEALAAAAVTELEPLRAPLNEGELERRLAAGLSPRQEELLRRWGYPYVLQEFRFHMTLTGPLADPQRREALQTKLAALFRPALTEPVPVAEVCLYSQASPEAPFLLTGRFPLGAAGAAAQGEQEEQTVR